MTDKEKYVILRNALEKAINILNKAKQEIEEAERADENINFLRGFLLADTIAANKELEKRYNKNK